MRKKGRRREEEIRAVDEITGRREEKNSVSVRKG